MQIDINAIIAKAKKFIDSPKGQKRLQEEQMKNFAESSTAQKAANAYFDALYQTVKSDPRASDSLVEIVGGLKNTSIVGKPVKANNNTITIDITFNRKSLERESLYLDRPGGGAQNILAIFNNGYDTNARMPIGDWEHRGRWYHIQAPSHRDALKFMQAASENYIQKYKDKNGIRSIKLDEIYNE